MKRYMLFLFEATYPAGGALDFVEDYDSIDQIAAVLRQLTREYEDGVPIWHVFDTELKLVVAQSAYLKAGEATPRKSPGERCVDYNDVVAIDADLVTDVMVWRL